MKQILMVMSVPDEVVDAEPILRFLRAVPPCFESIATVEPVEVPQRYLWVLKAIAAGTFEAPMGS